MAGDGLVQLWIKWEIQILVLTSFALQVFLLITGGIRRRSSSAVLRISLWLAYLLADSTAIYTLGHLSVSSGREGNQLVAFWAPFLLVHLGGPDNITAYSLEDNTLWLRHLQTLTVQVLGAVYVVYKYMAAGGSLLLGASVSMFVVGVLKYGERTWALKHGNLSSIRSSVQIREYCPSFDGILRNEDVDDEEILLQAHFHLYLCKSIFTDAGLSPPTKRFILLPEMELVDAHQNRENIKKWVEMEMSLMYDILHTKAAVIHTWCGLCIHLVSLLGTATALLLFQLSIRNGGTGDHGYHRYSRVDVIISYALLVGALLLEAISLCRAVLSSWTSQLLLRRRGENGWKRHLGDLVTSLRRRVKVARRRRWAGFIGQYNLMHLVTTRDDKELWTRLATKVGLQDWWNKLHFSGSFSPTDSFSMQELEDLVLPQLLYGSLNSYAFMLTRGSYSLQVADLYDKLPTAKWCVTNIDFNSSIFVWHIATDVYIHNLSDCQHEGQIKLVQATQVLSNYMIFLLVAKPHLLPGHTHRDLYDRILKDLVWHKIHMGMSFQESTKTYRQLIKDLFHHGGPSPSTMSRREKFAKALLRKLKNAPGVSGSLGSSLEAGLGNGMRLANELLEVELQPKPRLNSTLEVIFNVWVELMSYAAERCSRDSHARELSNGGEFITIIWLLARHLKDASL